jgi:hypothetical protein
MSFPFVTDLRGANLPIGSQTVGLLPFLYYSFRNAAIESMRAAIAANLQGAKNYSHSIVPGGLCVRS